MPASRARNFLRILSAFSKRKALWARPWASTLCWATSMGRQCSNDGSLAAGFDPASRWMIVDGFALLVGPSPAGHGFEVDGLKGNETSVRCEPGLIAASAPFAVAAGETTIVRPAVLAPTGVLPVVKAPGARPGWGVMAGDPGAGPRVSLPDFAVSVLRRDDLLALDFLFFNLALEGSAGKVPRLAIKDNTQPAYLVARFNSPQNIAEQAFLETYTDPDPA